MFSSEPSRGKTHISPKCEKVVSGANLTMNYTERAIERWDWSHSILALWNQPRKQVSQIHGISGHEFVGFGSKSASASHFSTPGRFWSNYGITIDWITLLLRRTSIIYAISVSARQIYCRKSGLGVSQTHDVEQSTWTVWTLFRWSEDVENRKVSGVKIQPTILWIKY